jgi:hypothetical protein
MCMSNGDMPAAKFYLVQERKARKQHRCLECCRDIKAGEVYQVTSGMWDGNIGRYKTCQHCLIATDWLMRECHGFLFEGVLEDILNHADEFYYSAKTGETTAASKLGIRLARLAVCMRRQWQSFKDPNTLMPVPEALPTLAEMQRLVLMRSAEAQAKGTTT